MQSGVIDARAPPVPKRIKDTKDGNQGGISSGPGSIKSMESSDDKKLDSPSVAAEHEMTTSERGRGFEPEGNKLTLGLRYLSIWNFY